MLEATGVTKVYKTGSKDLQVLKGIDLKIEKGKFVSIFGPSGAGKSTLLHILGGLDEPTQGAVILDKQDVYKLSDKKRAQIRNKEIGFVFQFYYLLREFSALENVMMPALIKTGTRDKGQGARDKAKELLGVVGLQDRADHRPNQLSGGEQQRVAIARALMNNPALLLCDEPTGNLDSDSGKGIIDLLSKLNKEMGSTIVVVTHEEEIARTANAVLFIKDGRFQ